MSISLMKPIISKFSLKSKNIKSKSNLSYLRDYFRRGRRLHNTDISPLSFMVPDKNNGGEYQKEKHHGCPANLRRKMQDAQDQNKYSNH